MVEIEIDGHKIAVPEGSTIMEAASQLNKTIPHFCYHKKLSIAANCRMCLVEVEKSPKALPACATPVTAGMVVHTCSEKTRLAQKSVMEFLLINHPLDCPICDQGGECQLQDLAVGYGQTTSRYQEAKRLVLPKEAGPLIAMQEMNRCIQCTRCVRFGQEIAGVMELGMLGRGEHSEIATFVNHTVDSEISGNMIDICPVGALTSKPFRYTARTWELSRRKSISPHDSLGTNLMVQIKSGKVMRVLPRENPAINECWISDRDRFSYEALSGETRLTAPMCKKNGQWQTVSWETALKNIAAHFQQENGQAASSTAFLAAPTATLEELFLLQKLADGVGQADLDFHLRRSDARHPADFLPWLGLSLTEFSALDRIFIIGSFFRKDHPLLAARLRSALRRQAGQLNMLHATKDDSRMPVANQITQPPSQWINALQQIMAAVAEKKSLSFPGKFTGNITEEAQAIAESLLSGQAVGIFLGNAAVQHPAFSELHACAQWLCENTGATLGFLTEGANTVGGYFLRAHRQPRHAKETLSKSKEQQEDKPRALGTFATQHHTYVLLHAEPEYDSHNSQAAITALHAAKMVIALTPFQPSEQQKATAHMLLPIAPFTETAGSFINCEGRIQSFHAVAHPVGETRPAWEVLRDLGQALGLEMPYDSAQAVRAAALEPLSAEEQGAEKLSCLNNFLPEAVCQNLLAQLPTGQAAATTERIADIPLYFSDALVRRAASLQQTVDAQTPRALISSALAERLAFREGASLRFTQNARSVVLPTSIAPSLHEQVVQIAAGHPATAALGDLLGPITVETP